MVEFLKVATRGFGMWVFRGRGICLGSEAGLKPDPRRFDPIFKDFSGRDSVPGSDATHLIAEDASGRNSLAASVQKGRTITKMTMKIINSVGTSFIMR
jgi:hypothetical protein